MLNLILAHLNSERLLLVCECMCLGVGGCAYVCVTKRNPLQIGIQRMNIFYCFHFINSYPVLTDGMSSSLMQ